MLGKLLWILKKKRREILVWRGGTLKFNCKRSVGQTVKLDKSLERNDKLAVCLQLAMKYNLKT